MASVYTMADLQASARPHSRKSRHDPWDQQWSAALADPSNLAKWEALFLVLDLCCNQSQGHNGSLLAAVTDAYQEFLRRHPFLYSHWNRYSLLQFKLAGPQASLDCLRRAVAEFPQSVLLWVDYLGAMVTIRKHEKKSENTDDALKAAFAKAEAAIGHDFNSDSFWDLYLSFCVEFDLTSLLEVYRRLIRIPLYQYARYYNQFLEKAQAASLEEALGPDAASIDNASSLSVVEQQQAVESYANNIFANTQQLVSELWPFEAAIVQQHYVPDPLLLSNCHAAWSAYLDHLVSKYQDGNDDLFFSLAKSVFERAVVPHSSDPALWIRYADFVAKARIDDLQPQDEDKRPTDDTAKEAITQPATTDSATSESTTNDPNTNESTAIEPNNKTEATTIESSNDTNEDTLQAQPEDAAETESDKNADNLSNGEPQAEDRPEPTPKSLPGDEPQKSVRGLTKLDEVSAIYRRAIFTFVPPHEAILRELFADYLISSGRFEDACLFYFETIGLFAGTSGPYVKEFYVKDLRSLLQLCRKNTDCVSILSSTVEGFFERVDRYKKMDTSKDETSSQRFSHEPANFSSRLSKLLNNDGICVLTVELLQAFADDRKPEPTRAFYNKYHTESVYARSVQFWKFFVDFETKQKNVRNVHSIVTAVKTTSALPKRAIDAFIDIQYEVTSANLAQAFADQELLDILVNVHAEKSADVYLNKPAQARLARNSHTIARQGSAQQYMLEYAKHVNYPGIFTDKRPTITNTPTEWISLLDSDIKPLPVPKFANLDKASAQVVYPQI